MPRLTSRRSEDGDAAVVWVARVVEHDGPGILRMLNRLLGHEQDVLDAYQDCFCKLASLDSGRSVAHVRAYAYRTAANIAFELIRARRRRSAHWEAVVASKNGELRARADAAGDFSADNGHRSEVDRMREAIAELPAHLRNVIVLRDLGKMSYREVGRILGIEPSTARVYRRHAVVRLAEQLGGPQS